MGCGDKKLSKYLTQTFTAHCNAMICQQVTLSGDAEWPKVADAVIEARPAMCGRGYLRAADGSSFCTLADGVVVQMIRCTNNGRFVCTSLATASGV